MSSADYSERGGTAALRASSGLASVSNQISTSAQSKSSTSRPPQTNSRPQFNSSQWNHGLSHAQSGTYLNSASTNIDNLEFPDPNDLAQNELLHDSVFPTWKDDTGDDKMETPEEMQKKDPLGTQIWKLYSRTKTRLPNQERMENLTWRMMAMNLRRREQMQAAYDHGDSALGSRLC